MRGVSERGPLTRCEVLYCRGYTNLRRRTFIGRYLCWRHARLVPDATWDRMNAAPTFKEQRTAWLRCIEIAIERAL